jgi:hypothetical protein
MQIGKLRATRLSVGCGGLYVSCSIGAAFAFYFNQRSLASALAWITLPLLLGVVFFSRPSTGDR